MPRFADCLKDLREKAGLTQQQLGERAGMHKLTVAKLEQGIREPTWATVQALAGALGVNCLAFTDGDGEAAAPKQQRPRGRPRKAPPTLPAPKKARGRPRKEK